MATASKQEPIRAKSPTREPSRALHGILAERFGDAVELVDAIDPYTVVRDHGAFLEVMTFLRDDARLSFDFLRSVTGVDWPDQGYIDSVYHLYSYAKQHAHVVKLRCPRARPEAPTVEGLWPTANWFEREAFDLLGIVYLGHSDLRRIMLPDDWVGHPLRKDYAEEAEYQGMGTTRASPLDAYAQMDEARRADRASRGEAAPPPISSSIAPPEGWTPPKKTGKAAAGDEGEG